MNGNVQGNENTDLADLFVCEHELTCASCDYTVLSRCRLENLAAGHPTGDFKVTFEITSFNSDSQVDYFENIPTNELPKLTVYITLTETTNGCASWDHDTSN